MNLVDRLERKFDAPNAALSLTTCPFIGFTLERVLSMNLTSLNASNNGVISGAAKIPTKSKVDNKTNFILIQRLINN